MTGKTVIQLAIWWCYGNFVPFWGQDTGTVLCGRNVLVLRRSTLKYLGMKCHVCNLFSTAPAKKKRWIRCLWGFWGFKDSGEPGFSLKMGPLIPIWLSLNFGFLPYYIRLLLSYSPFYDGLLSSGSPTIESTGLVLTPWFRGQEAWCKGPLVTGSAAGWRRLGEGPSVQAGCWLGETEGML